MEPEYDLQIDARWIIPVQPQGLLDHHSLLVKDGKIAKILPTANTKPARAKEQITLSSHALLPGFVNAHTHVAMSLLRGIADDLPLMDWLQNHIWPAENRWVSESFVEDGTNLAIAEMIRSGVTCFNDMYFYPEVTTRCAVNAGMRASIGLILIDYPSSWAANGDDYIDKGLALHDQYRNHPTITNLFAPHAPYSVSDCYLQRIGILANELDIGIHMHVQETADEIQQSVATHQCRPLERLNRLGLLGPSFLAVHMTQLTPKEIALVAEKNVQVIHCPKSNLKLASGFCPVGKLLAAKVNVAIGTDGSASNNNLDMLGELRTAALLAKAVQQDASCLSAARALYMATLGGARALGLDAITGSLKVGKAADCIAIDLDRVATQPLYDPISQIVYAAHPDQITDLWVEGKALLRKGVLTSLDEQRLLAKAKEWGQKIAGS